MMETVIPDIIQESGKAHDNFGKQPNSRERECSAQIVAHSINCGFLFVGRGKWRNTWVNHVSSSNGSRSSRSNIEIIIE